MRRLVGRRPSRRGFTMVEAALSMLLISVMLVVALNLAGSAARSRQARSDSQLGPALAGQLMGEILQACYSDPNGNAIFGRESGKVTANRSTWTDVDDYFDLTENSPCYRDGAAVPNASGWTRQSLVCYVDPADPSGASSGTDKGLKRITVTAIAPGGAQTVLTALRSRYGSQDQLLPARSQCLSYMTAELQVGSSAAASVSSGTNFSNRIILVVDPP